jgi:hypothetical protein
MNEKEFSIEDASDAERLRLVLHVDGKPHADATATLPVVHDLCATFGISEEQVLAELRGALKALFANELENVRIDRFREEPAGSQRFVAKYTLRDYRDISEGIVWYDLNKGETGPEPVPAIVRDKMRYVAHEKLVAGNEAAEKLRELFRP